MICPHSQFFPQPVTHSYPSVMSVTKSYLERSKIHPNPAAKALLELMDRKQSNLSLAADLTSKAALIELADKVGPHICLLKVGCLPSSGGVKTTGGQSTNVLTILLSQTHIDVVDDFDQDLVDQLTALAKKHDFMIFEDRKFADIGKWCTLIAGCS